MATLKKEWRLEVEMMADIIGAADVDEMLSQRSCREFAFGYPAAPAERAHVEELYYGERSAGLTVGEVRRSTVALPPRGGRGAAAGRAARQPDATTRRGIAAGNGRRRVKVIEFLQAIQSLEGIAAKHGHPGKDDLARYLRQSAHSLEKATAFVKLVWKIANPKEKKPTKKDAKVPEHIATKCGFPSPRRRSSGRC